MSMECQHEQLDKQWQIPICNEGSGFLFWPLVKLHPHISNQTAFWIEITQLIKLCNKQILRGKVEMPHTVLPCSATCAHLFCLSLGITSRLRLVLYANPTIKYYRLYTKTSSKSFDDILINVINVFRNAFNIIIPHTIFYNTRKKKEFKRVSHNFVKHLIKESMLMY